MTASRRQHRAGAPGGGQPTRRTNFRKPKAPLSGIRVLAAPRSHPMVVVVACASIFGVAGVSIVSLRIPGWRPNAINLCFWIVYCLHLLCPITTGNGVTEQEDSES